MANYKPTKSDLRRIDDILRAYEKNKEPVSRFLNVLRGALSDSSALNEHIHSLKWRLKDPEHLKNKLIGKLIESKIKGVIFNITPENLFEKINDLAGIRVLHLYTRQIKTIDRIIRDILIEERYSLLEGPTARTWDDEYRKYFSDCGIRPIKSESLYTSVHYIVGSFSKTRITGEIQVRTLMEEVWGEVSHSVNYPTENANFACREQIKVLARVTSSATRLVDSIFLTLENDTRKP